MRILLIFLFIIISYQSNAQYQSREVAQRYAGISYSLVFFTNPDVNKIYPTIDLNRSGLLSEVNGFFGYRINKYFAAEISPSFLFAKTNQGLNGFWFGGNSQRFWYVPQDASLFALGLNLKARMYPFASNSSNVLRDFYLSIGGGMMYFKEQYTNYLYNDSSYNAYVLSIRDDKNSVWAPNISFSLGYSSDNNFGYGFDVAYRIVPLPINRNTVLSTSNAGNFSSLNISAKILFNL